MTAQITSQGFPTDFNKPRVTTGWIRISAALWGRNEGRDETVESPDSGSWRGPSLIAKAGSKIVPKNRCNQYFR